jgi:acetylornithine deacetylase/succinyl-diaminopimelate desuccinylase-like protein
MDRTERRSDQRSVGHGEVESKMSSDGAGLTDQQQDWVAAAWSAIDVSQLRALVAEMVSIPSPTGQEGPLARFLTGRLESIGLRSVYQPLDETQANAIGFMESSGTGPSLLLYAPIDTLTVGRQDEDVPGVGPQLRADMRPEATGTADWIVGLGASNPKGHGACILAAAAAIREAGIPLTGDLIVGLGAGGMPSNSRPTSASPRRNVGQGVGCSYMLEQGVFPDFAIIAKPGWSVAWEEVGLSWFRVTVRGTFNYVGSRHRLPYRNPIVAAAVVIEELERWFADYSKRHTSGLVAPQGQIGFIQAGWESTASLSPASCTLLIDLRLSPRTSPAEARQEFREVIERIRTAHPDIEVECDMVLSIPGTSTPPDNWIVQACIRSWEAVAEKAHEPLLSTSGATDANILRNRGVPTARVGMPKAIDDQGIEVDFAMGMNASDVRHMVRLTKLLIHSAVATCTVPRSKMNDG